MQPLHMERALDVVGHARASKCNRCIPVLATSAPPFVDSWMRILLPAIAICLLVGCSSSKTAEEVTIDERVAILKTTPHRFDVPVGDTETVRERFRAWVECWGDLPLVRDEESIMEMEWPKDPESALDAFRVSIVVNGDIARIRVEGSDKYGYDLERLVLFLRDGTTPIMSWFEPCATLDAPSSTGS